MYQGNGVVSQVSAKPFTDKWGKNITLYSFQIQGDNGWYRTGTNAPQCNQGDQVQFVFEQQGNNRKVDNNSIQVTGSGGGAPQQAPPQMQQGNQPMQAPQAVPQAAPAPQQARGGANTRDDYWKNKEEYDKGVTQPRIAYAAAQKSAVAIVTAALANDVLGFGNAKKADKMTMLMEYVEQVTCELALKLHHAHEIMATLEESGGLKEPQIVDEEDMYANG